MARRRVGNLWIATLVTLLLLGAATVSFTLNRTTPTAKANTDASITISNFMFHPMTLSVAPGAAVMVTNADSVTHTFSAVGGAFDTGEILGHHAKSFLAPLVSGTYRYMCDIHQFMVGTIVVQ